MAGHGPNMTEDRAFPTPSTTGGVDDVRDLDLGVLSDEQFDTLVLLVGAEQQRRALIGGDLDALGDEGFRNGFGNPPQVRDPWVRDGLLVAPGGRFDQGAHNHRCSFVKVGGHWVWEHPNKVADDIRRNDDRRTMRSVTVVALTEGDRVDLVNSRSRNGIHTMTAARSFLYRNGELELIDSRVVGDLSHR